MDTELTNALIALTNAINQLNSLLSQSFDKDALLFGFFAVISVWLSGFGFGLLHSLLKKTTR